MEKYIQGIQSLDLEEDPTKPIDFCKEKFKKLGHEVFKQSTERFISNILPCNSENLPKNLHIYGIKMIELTNMEKILETKEIKQTISHIKFIPEFKKQMNKLLSSYHISGNTVFAEEKDSCDLESLKLYVKFFENNIELMSVSKNEELIHNVPEGVNAKLYEITFEKSALELNKLSKENYLRSLYPSKLEMEQHKNSILSYCNIKSKDTLKLLGYKRYDYSRNFAYYKEIHNNLNQLIPLKNNNSCVYMAPGVNLTYNFYSEGSLMLRSNIKYKMLRQDTYFDLFCEMGRKFDNYRRVIVGRHGLKTYQTVRSEKFLIENVQLLHPKEIPFENKNAENDKILTIFDYYMKKYKIKIDAEVQPVLITSHKQKNRATREEITVISYIFAKYAYILGKLDTDNIDLSPITREYAQEKFDKILRPLRELENFCMNNTGNIQLNMKDFFGKILKEPELRNLSKEVINLDRKNRIDIRTLQADEENQEISSWVFLGFGISESEYQFFLENLQKAAETLNIKVKKPSYKSFLDRKDLFNNTSSYNQDIIEDHIYNIITESKNREDKGKSPFSLVISIVSYDFENPEFYKMLKQSLYKSKIGIPAQNMKYSKIKKGNLSIFTCVLIQIFAKLSLPLWYFRSPKELKRTVIISYSVKRDKTKNKTISTVFITTDRLFNDYIFFSSYSENDTNIFCPEIVNLMRKALESLFENNEEVDNFYIENLIILREGVNESQKNLCISLELNKEVLGKLKKFCEEKTSVEKSPKIIVIFVNDTNDTKIFKKIRSDQSISGLEKYYSLTENNDLQVDNVDIGTLVDHESGITISDNHYEFYICSTVPTVGCSNLTKYTIVYDETQISNVLFGLMYNLCYLYFNNPQPIKIPAPLYFARKMNNYIISNLGFVPKKMRFSNYSL